MVWFLDQFTFNPKQLCRYFYPLSHTLVRTLSISGLKSRVLKLSFLSLKMTVKSGLEFILKLTEPLQRYLLSCQANSAILGKYFCTGQQQLWRGSVNFKINSRPVFTIIFKLKNDNFKSRDFSPLIKRVTTGVSLKCLKINSYVGLHCFIILWTGWIVHHCTLSRTKAMRK